MRPADLPRFSTIGERVKYWRLKRGYSRAKLAKLIGAKGPSTISDLELGNTQRPQNVHKYADVLKVAIKYLETDFWEDPPATASSEAKMPLDVDPTRLEQLDPIERDLVSIRVNMLLDQIEAARPRTRKKQSGG